MCLIILFFFSSRRRHTRFDCDWSSDVCSSDLVEAVRTHGEVALRKHAERFGDVSPGAPLYHNRADLARALAGLSPEERTRLERVAARIRAFAVAQRGALGPVRVPVPGGIAEHRIAPIERAGCYAPGGRYPLP